MSTAFAHSEKTELEELVDIFLRSNCSCYAPLLLYPNVLPKLTDHHIEAISRSAYAWAPVVTAALTILRSRQKFVDYVKVDTLQCVEYITNTLSQRGYEYAHLLRNSGVIESLKDVDIYTISQCAGSWGSVLCAALMNIRDCLTTLAPDTEGIQTDTETTISPPVREGATNDELKRLVDTLDEKGFSYAFLLTLPSVLVNMRDHHIEIVSKSALAWDPVVSAAIKLIRDRQKPVVSTKVQMRACLERLVSSMRCADYVYSPLLLNSGVIESITDSDLRRISECVGLWGPIVLIALTNIRKSLNP